MLGVLQKVFGIYPGEGSKSIKFCRLAFFYALGITTLETLSDGYFLGKAGAQSLPIVFLITALSMICISTIVLYSLRFTSPYRILTVALSLGAILSFTAAIWICGTPPAWFWFAFKISSRMLFTVLVACSWTFIDQYHDLQDAKRVYSLYSAAYFLGNIASGILINFALNILGVPLLLIIASLSLLTGIAEARKIALKTDAVHDDSTEGIFSSDRSNFASIVRLIMRSPFTIYLLSLSLITQLLITVSEYSYMDSFGRIFHSMNNSESYIAEFLGKTRACISACNILVGFFFYSRFIRRVGLNNAILITPIFFLGVYSQWVAYDSLLIAILGLIAVDGILFTIEDNCFNLLSNAVPAKLKSKVRIINDSFFEPIGMLLSALLLFALQSGSRWLGLALTLIALAITLLIRELYSKAILTNLKDSALHFERKLKDWLASMGRREQKEARKTILKALRSDQEEVRLLACESLLSLQDISVLSQILEVSRGFGTLSKIHLLRLFEVSPFSNDPLVLEAIASWMDESESPEFCKWANFFLAKRGLLQPEKVEENLDSSDPLLRGSAILTLQKAHLPQPIESPLLRNRPEISLKMLSERSLSRAIATKKIDLMLKSAHIDEISMALDILAEGNSPSDAEKALPFLSHEAILVKRSAARCISRLAAPRASRDAPRLIEELVSARDNLFRLLCLDALGKMADSTTVKDLLVASIYFRPNERRRTEEIVIEMGLKTVPILLTLTKDLSIPERSRILAGKILGRLALPQLQANLVELIDLEIDRAYFYFYFGHCIQKQYPLYDLQLLQNALLTGFRSVIDFIIHLLGAAGSLEEPEMLVRALYSRNAKVQSHAVESLEKTCDPRLFRRIAPLVDDLPLEEKLAACLRFKIDLPQLSLSDLLATLEQSGSLYDKVVAARLKAMLQMPNWRQELREQIKRSDETFHHFAYELLET